MNKSNDYKDTKNIEPIAMLIKDRSDIITSSIRKISVLKDDLQEKIERQNKKKENNPAYENALKFTEKVILARRNIAAHEKTLKEHLEIFNILIKKLLKQSGGELNDITYMIIQKIGQAMVNAGLDNLICSPDQDYESEGQGLF